MPLPQSRTPSLAAGDSRGAVPVRVALLTLLLAVAAAAGSWFVWERFQELEQQVAALGQQVEQAEERAEEADTRAAVANRRADAAEEAAGAAEERARDAEQEAVNARSQAEASDEARQLAQAQSERASAEAEEARLAARQAEEEAERIRQARQAELDRLQTALAQIVETRRTALGLIMNLGEDRIQFDFDEAELRPGARELLSRIVGVLLTSPEGYMVQVYGHTDDVGSAEYNEELSERRARSVRDYLVDAGIPEEIILTRGFGKSSPLVDGTDPESRQRNRRVEIGIVDTVVQYRRAAGEEQQGPAGKKKKGGGGLD